MTRSYDPVMPYITRVHNGYTGDRTISQYDYTYDALGRRTAIASSGEAFTFTNVSVRPTAPPAARLRDLVPTLIRSPAASRRPAAVDALAPELWRRAGDAGHR